MTSVNKTAQHVTNVTCCAVNPAVLCVKTAKRRITQTTPRNSPRTDSSFLTPTVVPPKICAQSDPPIEHNDLAQYPLIVPQP